MIRILAVLLLLASLPLAATAARVSVAVELDGGVIAIIHQGGRVQFGISGAASITYDASGQNIQQLGGQAVQYDSTNERVVQIGSMAVTYDSSNQRVTQIGSITVGYDAQGQNVISIGGAQIAYDAAGQNVTGVTGTAGQGIHVLFE